MMLRNIYAVLVFFVLASLSASAYGQDARIQGQVSDSSGAGVPRASVRVVDQQTSTERKAETNGTGQFIVPGLTPGLYKIIVEASGFSTAVSNVITLNVAQNAVLDFKLQIGSASSEIVVNADNLSVNTTDGSVSTVIDRQFVENLPLNGRSFQALLYLTPGVNLNVGAGPSNPNGGQSQGQFVVNGQRADTNYWMIDGVSANIGISGFGTGGGGPASGAIGGFNALGGTSALVSVDALQEFRIETSTYAPEFGRVPGGQISIQTRSGANQFHGTLFDYLRNTDLDAADWFANHNGLAKAAEIQNDFGGVVGGPIRKNKTFFFFSYEGLRLALPSTFVGTVPDLAARSAAIPAMQSYLNMYPLPKPGAVDVSPGLAPYSATFSEPSSTDAYSLRIDHELIKNVHLFGRYNYAPSTSNQRGSDGIAANSVFENTAVTKTATVGATWMMSSQVVDDARFNYSFSRGTTRYSTDTFGGAAALPPVANLFPDGLTLQNGSFLLEPALGTNMIETAGLSGDNAQRQYNFVDTLSVQKGVHSLKFGVDYRRLSPSYHYVYVLAPVFLSVAELESGTPLETIQSNYAPPTFLFRNLGVYAQDTWRVNSRLNLTYGLRWDVDFAATTEIGPSIGAVTGFSTTNLSELALAPAGTPAYSTQFGNVAPRIGGAYRISTNPDWGLVLRGGFGVFYGLASTEIASRNVLKDPPFGIEVVSLNVPFPTPAADAMLPPITPPNAKNGQTLVGFDPHLNLPYAFEWNATLEQSLGKTQAFSLSYIGASNRRNLESESVISPNSNYSAAVLIGNTGISSYEALQAQFKRSLMHGLQALVSYTWSHSIDNGSYGAYSNGSLGSVNANRGDSDYDLRNVFTAALTYYVPAIKNSTLTRAITGGWSTDNIVQVRSGPPIDITDGNFAALTNVNSSVLIRPDVVAGQPEYLTGSQYPGGKALNPASFIDPPVDPVTHDPIRQGNLGRNARRALGLAQWDFAMHREFPIYDKVKLQFRAELFNILNHPNFGPFNNDFLTSNASFGQSTQMLNQYLGGLQGSGTQNPLYTPGSPRSGELALKLVF